jgi:hypothetical protein
MTGILPSPGNPADYSLPDGTLALTRKEGRPLWMHRVPRPIRDRLPNTPRSLNPRHPYDTPAKKDRKRDKGLLTKIEIAESGSNRQPGP